MEGLGDLISTTTGTILVCVLLIIRELKSTFMEYLKHKKSANQRAETDIHIKNTSERLQEISASVQKILSRWS